MAYVMNRGGYFSNRSRQQANDENKPQRSEESFEGLSNAGEREVTLKFKVTFTLLNGGATTSFYAHLNDGSDYSQKRMIVPAKPNGETLIPLGTEGELTMIVSNNAKQVREDDKATGRIDRFYDLKPKFVKFVTDSKVYLSTGGIMSREDYDKMIAEEAAKDAKAAEAAEAAEES